MFGSIGGGEALRATVMAQHTGTPRMPPAEGALLALRQLSPVLADQVLDRARHHYGVAGAARLPGADDAAASSH